MIQGAERGYIDDVIIPQATRPCIARAGDAARKMVEMRGRKHDNCRCELTGRITDPSILLIVGQVCRFHFWECSAKFDVSYSTLIESIVGGDFGVFVPSNNSSLDYRHISCG